MSAEQQATSDRTAASEITVHGFRVQTYGESLSTTFKNGLKQLKDRGFCDPSCVIVKTRSGSRSGITHAGGRYVHAENTYSSSVMQEMRSLGMEPPTLPFVVAPGVSTLFHEWGHHIDRVWSRESQAIDFSFRWFSWFYQLAIYDSLSQKTSRLVSTDADAAQAILAWNYASSELFANLFANWMLGENSDAENECKSRSMNLLHQVSEVDVLLFPGISEHTICAETFRLFESGIQMPIALPAVRSDLLGVATDRAIDYLHKTVEFKKVYQW